MDASHGNEEEAIAELNVIPFIDICLVLLIIVLVTSAAEQKFAELALPSTVGADYRDMNLAYVLSVTHDEEIVVKKDASGAPILDKDGKEQPILDIEGKLVYVLDKDGKKMPKLDKNKKRVYQFYFGEGDGSKFAPKNIWTALRNIQGDSTWDTLVIRSDKDTPYEYLSMAIQCAQALGVADICLAVKDQNKAGPSAP